MSTTLHGNSRCPRGRTASIPPQLLADARKVPGQGIAETLRTFFFPSVNLAPQVRVFFLDLMNYSWRRGKAEKGGRRVVTETVVSSRQHGIGLTASSRATWQTAYVRTSVLIDGFCALIAGALAVQVRFASPYYRPTAYLAITLTMPLVWLAAVALSGGYDARFIGVGSDLSVEDSVRLDVRYVENWPLLLDLQILWKTGRAVSSGSGAY